MQTAGSEIKLSIESLPWTVFIDAWVECDTYLCIGQSVSRILLQNVEKCNLQPLFCKCPRQNPLSP
jgi:hypothetical protein